MILPDTPTRRALIAAALGLVSVAIVATSAAWQMAPLFGWAVAAFVWVGWTWWAVLRLDAEETRVLAMREEPHRATTDLVLITASLVSLVAVVLGVVKAGNESGGQKLLLLAAGVACIILSWGVVHTVFTLRYAALYHRGSKRGIDFNGDDEPTYIDFAYLAFTIGMTYQVSDTDLTSKAIRHTALRHALLSYLFGTVIIATTINIAAGLAK
jgi:uncharacterized membrane protein